MLPAAHRLADTESFRRTVRGGSRAGSGTLVVHLGVPGGTAGEAGVGFVVSRAVGGSVVRNRVKRRLRHLARARLADLPRGSVLVVRALPPAAEASYAVLGRDLDRCLDRCLDRVSA